MHYRIVLAKRDHQGTSFALDGIDRLKVETMKAKSWAGFPTRQNIIPAPWRRGLWCGISFLAIHVIRVVFVFILKMKSVSIRCNGQGISVILTVVSQRTKMCSRDLLSSSRANIATSRATVRRSDAAFEVTGNSVSATDSCEMNLATASRRALTELL
ncbi:hypothetical protein F5879DRAFT_611188 [Lentinula edodes]|nr:hypothetical protein F5879DRAFT_611188 [Lentinula edodes]